jgi:hypothetical protein
MLDMDDKIENTRSNHLIRSDCNAVSIVSIYVSHTRILIKLKKLTSIHYLVLTLLTVFITVLPKVRINRLTNVVV